MTPKELKALIKVMRQEGVTRIKMDGVEFDLGSKPTKRENTKKSKALTPQQFVEEVISTDGMSEEDLLFYSAGGLPQENN